MRFTQPQINEIFEDLLKKKEGLNQVLKLTLETLMKIERSEHQKASNDYANGYRSRKVFGTKQMN